MKTFLQIREKVGKHPEGKMVFSKRINTIPTMIHKVRNSFVAYVDGDKLDTYRTQRDAEKAINAFIKVLKK